MPFDLDPSYKDVATRIDDFKTKHPEGCLRPVDTVHPYRIETIDGRTFIVYAAAAYRSPDDKTPGIGVAWEPFPGLTPYTKNSELQNAETSAWGRAIVAVLASESKSVASAEEVRNRKMDASNGPDPALVAELTDAALSAPTSDALRQVWRDAASRGLLTTATTRADGRGTVPLGDLIAERKQELDAGEGAPLTASRQEAADGIRSRALDPDLSASGLAQLTLAAKDLRDVEVTGRLGGTTTLGDLLDEVAATFGGVKREAAT